LAVIHGVKKRPTNAAVVAVCARQSLNSRLELYVLRVKEMEDAKNVAERELETIRQRMQMDMDKVKARLTRELEETRGKLDHEMEQTARLQMLEQEQHIELVKLREQMRELSEIKTLAESLRVELTREQANAKSSKETLSVQTTQLQAARRRIKELERENRSHFASLSDATKELEELRKKSSDFDLTRDVEITTIRKEMNAKHQEALAQWKKDTEERLLSVETEVRSHFEGVVSGFRSQVDDLSTELESTRTELDRTAIDYEESLKVRQQLTEKVAQLEREYREERTKFKEDRKTFESTIERFRVSKFAKEQEFNDLMDVKIALDAEITAYRRILDREESRVGLPTPNTKGRKRKSESFSSSSSSSGSAVKRVKRTPPPTSVQIVSLDLEKDRIVIENASDKPVSLGNWEVRGRLPTQVFRFPATYSIRGKSKLTVHSSKRNKKAKDERKSDEDSFLATKFSLNAEGDLAVLTTAEGVPVSLCSEGLPEAEVKSFESEIRGDFDEDEGAPRADGVSLCSFGRLLILACYLTPKLLCSLAVRNHVSGDQDGDLRRPFLLSLALRDQQSAWPRELLEDCNSSSPGHGPLHLAARMLLCSPSISCLPLDSLLTSPQPLLSLTPVESGRRVLERRTATSRSRSFVLFAPFSMVFR
jgi:hypothetical protein